MDSQRQVVGVPVRRLGGMVGHETRIRINADVEYAVDCRKEER
jgi:hypothetical protein